MNNVQPLTKDLIRRCFGPRARIKGRWFADGYRVTTDTGGEVLIWDKGTEILSGGEDVYRATTLISRALWGNFQASGSREAVMAFMAHGEMSGVNVQPAVKRGWFGRFVIGCIFACGVVNMANGEPSGFTICLIAALFWWLAARGAKRKQRQFEHEVGYMFPRVHGTTGAASDEDLDRENWL